MTLPGWTARWPEPLPDGVEVREDADFVYVVRRGAVAFVMSASSPRDAVRAAVCGVLCAPQPPDHEERT
jgi:hypothetical protein